MPTLMRTEPRPYDVYVGKKFRERQSGRVLTVTELTEKGFKYEFEHGLSVKYGYSNGIPLFGMVHGGECYVNTPAFANGMFEMMYEELVHKNDEDMLWAAESG